MEKLKDELNNLKSIERPKIINQIAEARDKGDLSENASMMLLKKRKDYWRLELLGWKVSCQNQEY